MDSTCERMKRFKCKDKKVKMIETERDYRTTTINTNRMTEKESC